MNNNIITGIDVGTTKIVVAVAEKENDAINFEIQHNIDSDFIPVPVGFVNYINNTNIIFF